jgi:hypothetical protein
MRTLLCAIPALLALAGPALAEPQQLDEAQLGGIAAGQEAPGFNLSTSQLNTTSTVNSMTNTSEQILNQSLGGVSTNSTYSTGVNSSNVGATGSAFTNVGGSILP